MTVIDKAVSWAVGIAQDDTHGYDQVYREGPDYDCSSLVINAWRQAGVPLTCAYTGTMRDDMLRHGFKLVTDGSRRKGDVLLAHNDRHQHTAMMIDGTHLVQASSNENGGIKGGLPGDQTGREIATTFYYDMPWDCVLRYSKDNHEIEPIENKGVDSVSRDDSKDNQEIYVVQPGDTMYGIAQRFGKDVYTLAKLNGIADPGLIYPGQVLKLTEPAEEAEPECEACKIELPEEPAPEDGVRLYTIQPGDTLSGIAYRVYGRWSYYQWIAWYNRLDNPHSIMVGQQIKLPPIKELLK